VGKPIMSKSPMVAIGKKAAKELPDGAVLNVVSSTADKGHGSALQTVIEKIATKTGKKFTTNLMSLETLDTKEGKKLSATNMRNALANEDYETFKLFLPEDLDEQEVKEIYNILSQDNNKLEESILYSIIREMVSQKKVKGKIKYCLMSKKKNKKTGKRKNLGCYSKRSGAEKRERQITRIKHMKKKKLEEYEIVESSVSGMAGGFGFAGSKKLEETLLILLSKAEDWGQPGPGLPGNFKPHVDPNPYKYVEDDIYRNIVKVYKNANISLGMHKS